MVLLQYNGLIMKIQLPKTLLDLIKKFEESNFEIYIVGGAVRDIIMGKDIYDWDLTTNATPEDMLKIFKNAYYSNEFGMVGIPNEIEGERPYEITTFRTEQGYSDSRRPDKVEWGKSLEEDLERRDFTINAMALQLTSVNDTKTKSKETEAYVECDMRLIDVHSGQKDLESKLIRTVGDANERFAEDSLRMMRAVRIASEIGFTIESKTFEAIKSNAPRIHKISHERVRDELLKILASGHPYEGIMLFRSTGLMQEILPEMEKTFGVEQKSPGRHHIYDVGTHSLFSLKFVAEKTKDPIVRFATLIHDIGKPQTYKKLDTGTITFYNHELVSARIAKRIAERLRFSNKEKDKLWTLVRYHQFTVDERQTDSAIRRFIRKVGLEYIEDMLSLRTGDRLGGGAQETSWRLEEFKKRLIEVQKQPFSVRDLKIKGDEIMEFFGMDPGPKIGEILNKLFKDVVDAKIENKREDLLAELTKIKSEEKK